jgi:putative zinc-dependent peptidase DUF5700
MFPLELPHWRTVETGWHPFRAAGPFIDSFQETGNLMLTQNIMQSITHHKHGGDRRPGPTGSRFVLLAGLAILFLIAGCGDNTGQQGDGDTASDTDVTQSALALAVTTSVNTVDLDTWVSLGHRLQKNERVLESDYSRMLTLPAYSLIKDLRARKLNPIIMKNVMSYAFAPRNETGKIIWNGRMPKRRDLAANFDYAALHIDDIAAYSTRLKQLDLGTLIMNQVDGYLSERQLPERLDFSFVVGESSIAYAEPTDFVIDATLAIAADSRLLPNIVAASVYRQFSGMGDNNPKQSPDGASMLRNTFRKIRQEGIAGWIEKLPQVMFDERHATLYKSNVYREDIVVKGTNFLISFTEILDKVLDPDTNLLEMNSSMPHDHLFLTNAYQRVGYAMTALIVDFHGEEKLKEASGSTLGFLELYQEAALAGTAVYELGDLPPFPELTYQRLLELLGSA